MEAIWSAMLPPPTSLPTNAPTHALVGNAAPVADHASAIDSHSEVWRFNNCPGIQTRLRGTRTTMLWLVNSGGSMRERLHMRGFADHPAMRGCRRIGFPVHPNVLNGYHPVPRWHERLRGARNDWTGPALQRFGATHSVTILPEAHYFEACEAIGLRGEERRRVFPSTGFLAAHWLLATRATATVTLYGFTWEGWDSHAWDGERDWFAAREADGRVRIERSP